MLTFACGIGAIASPGIGTSAGIGVPAMISGSGSAREPGAGRPFTSSSVPASKTSWIRHIDHIPCAKCG